MCQNPMMLIRPEAMPHATPRYATYQAAGHSRKLLPIINSLSALDFDPDVWSDVRTTSEKMESSFEAVLLTLPNDSPQRSVVETLLETSRNALRAHNELFASHRRVCVSALSLRS